MSTVAVVIGTRPDAIKMAPVILALRQQAQAYKTLVVSTGQHRQMLDQVLQAFSVQPDVDLQMMQEGQQLGDVTARLLTALEAVWAAHAPDLILVQGDTTSSFAASLAAYYRKIPIGHVEAGLRSYQKYAPFPEEANRHLIDTLADYCFAPTEQAKAHLLSEGVPAHRITVTGNTGIDALQFIRRQIRSTQFSPTAFEPQALEGKRVVLVTAHRRESFGQGLENICHALLAIGQARPDVQILYPMHLNPAVQRTVRSRLADAQRICLMPPLDYQSFVYAMERAHLILTDSGGIQEEALSFGMPMLVMRDVTERVEAINAGQAELVGTEPARIAARALDLLAHTPAAAPPRQNPFGDGRASERIVETLRRVLA